MSRLPTSTIETETRRRGGMGFLSYWYFVFLVAGVAVYYLFLLSNGTFQLIAPEMFDKVYDSMLVHLLHGEFTVDPRAIDFESFTRNGKTYTYFGVFPALLRVVAMPFTDVARVELARLSCLTAVVIFVALQLRMLLIVHDSLVPQRRIGSFLGIMIAATVLSGPQLYILASASIYHEPILWSAAMGAGFNFVVVRAAFGGRGLHTGERVWLALLAGLAINTRASIGAALYFGTALLVGWAAWDRQHASAARRIAPAAFAYDLGIWLPIAVLATLAATAGLVNFERWGNPFTFADFRYYDFSRLHRLNDFAVLHDYGSFSLGRLWIGVLYYTTGIPYVLKGVPPFAEFLHRRFVGIEAPPITPLLTNPLTVVLAAIGVYRLFRRPELSRSGAMVLRLALIGNAPAVLLICAAMYLALRYRFDFAPFMTLAALVGYRAVSGGMASETSRKRLPVAALGLCVLGIIGSHYILLVHKVWSFAVPMPVRLTLLPYAPFAHAAFDH